MASAKSYDLSELAQELRQRGDCPELVGGIVNQLHMSSRRADLSHAEDLLTMLDEMEPGKTLLPRDGPAWPRFTNIQGALLTQAIILYARAAAPGDQGRGLPFKIRKAFTPAQLALHEKVCVLRSRAIAHFDGEDRQDWHADTLTLIRFDDRSWTYGSPHFRTTYRSEVHSDLKVLVGALRPYLESLGKETMDALNTRLQEALASDPALDALIEAHPFDAVAFYGASPEAQAAARRLHEFGDGEYVWHTNVPLVRP